MFVMIDPPYGGIVKLIANTINLIKKGFKDIFYDCYDRTEIEF